MSVGLMSKERILLQLVSEKIFNQLRSIKDMILLKVSLFIGIMLWVFPKETIHAKLFMVFISMVMKFTHQGPLILILVKLILLLLIDVSLVKAIMSWIFLPTQIVCQSSKYKFSQIRIIHHQSWSVMVGHNLISLIQEESLEGANIKFLYMNVELILILKLKELNS